MTLIPADFATGPLKTALIDTAAASGDTEVVAAVSGKEIVVHHYHLLAAAAVSVEFQDTAVGAISGLYPLTAAAFVSSGFKREGWFRTTAGEALDINASTTVQVGGMILYTEE